MYNFVLDYSEIWCTQTKNYIFNDYLSIDGPSDLVLSDLVRPAWMAKKQQQN